MLRAAPPGHPLQKPTVVQWDIGAMLSADGAADESVSPQSGIIQCRTLGASYCSPLAFHRLMVRASPLPSRPAMPLWLRSRRYEIAFKPRSMVEGAEQPSALPH